MPIFHSGDNRINVRRLWKFGKDKSRHACHGQTLSDNAKYMGCRENPSPERVGFFLKIRENK
jgi:hypothetical protein